MEAKIVTNFHKLLSEDDVFDQSPMPESAECRNRLACTQSGEDSSDHLIDIPTIKEKEDRLRTDDRPATSRRSQRRLQRSARVRSDGATGEDGRVPNNGIQPPLPQSTIVVTDACPSEKAPSPGHPAGPERTQKLHEKSKFNDLQICQITSRHRMLPKENADFISMLTGSMQGVTTGIPDLPTNIRAKDIVNAVRHSTGSNNPKTISHRETVHVPGSRPQAAQSCNRRSGQEHTHSQDTSVEHSPSYSLMDNSKAEYAGHMPPARRHLQKRDAPDLADRSSRCEPPPNPNSSTSAAKSFNLKSRKSLPRVAAASNETSLCELAAASKPLISDEDRSKLFGEKPGYFKPDGGGTEKCNPYGNTNIECPLSCGYATMTQSMQGFRSKVKSASVTRSDMVGRNQSLSSHPSHPRVESGKRTMVLQPANKTRSPSVLGLQKNTHRSNTKPQQLLGKLPHLDM